MKNILIAIPSEIDTANKRVEYLYRLEQRYKDKVNSLMGTRAYQVFYDEKFKPAIKRINDALAIADRTATILPAKSMINNDRVMARQALREAKRYDAIISRDISEVRNV